MGEGNEPQIVGEDGKPLGRVARVQREPIATCPRCGGQIRENSRAYGCSSWKSKKNPGCGFVIWKSMKGRDITPDEAKTVIEKGKVGPLQFRDRAGEFEGYLVLTDEKAVEVQARRARQAPKPPGVNPTRSSAGSSARRAFPGRPDCWRRCPAPTPLDCCSTSPAGAAPSARRPT